MSTKHAHVVLFQAYNHEINRMGSVISVLQMRMCGAFVGYTISRLTCAPNACVRHCGGIGRAVGSACAMLMHAGLLLSDPLHLWCPFPFSHSSSPSFFSFSLPFLLLKLPSDVILGEVMWLPLWIGVKAFRKAPQWLSRDIKVGLSRSCAVFGAAICFCPHFNFCSARHHCR